MDGPRSLVHIVVVAPPEQVGRSERRIFDDTFEALARLGGEIEAELVRDAAGCLALMRARDVQLVLVDRVPRPDLGALLQALPDAGPPVVVVTDESAETASLDAFRNGAAECVRVGPDYAEVLPIVVLEQLRRFRRQRERGQADRRIRDLQRFNENIIQNLNSALLVIDASGVILTANAHAEDILGAARGSIEGLSVWKWLPDASEGAVLRRTLETGERFQGAEDIVLREDGVRVPIGISCSPLVVEGDAFRLAVADSSRLAVADSSRLAVADALRPAVADASKLGVAGDPQASAGGPVQCGAIAIFRDLSEIRQLERQVVQSEKMASIGQLAAGVAHEINNPMGFIHANLFQMAEYLVDMRSAWDRVEDLQKAVHVGDIDEIRALSEQLSSTVRQVDLGFVQTDFAKAIRESQDGAERIRHIVRDLRDFSHQDSAKPTGADINQCLDSTANIVLTMMKHSVVLEKDYGELPKIRCYPMQLKQVFMNLLVNSYQSIEEKLGGQSGTGTIHVSTECRGDHLVVTVRDTGEGIEPADLNRIFDPFFTTKEVGVGTGLGLATSFNIVERHGGRLSVTSTRGEGSTFEVFLPIAGPPGEQSPDFPDTDSSDTDTDPADFP